MGSIIFKIIVIALLVGVLGLVAYDDRRTKRIRKAEDEAAEKQRKRS